MRLTLWKKVAVAAAIAAPLAFAAPAAAQAATPEPAAAAPSASTGHPIRFIGYGTTFFDASYSAINNLNDFAARFRQSCTYNPITDFSFIPIWSPDYNPLYPTNLYLTARCRAL